MSTPSSGNSWKSNDGVSDQFPAGLRVLVVDDDSICLMILEAMLKKCLYEVTKCNRADIALKLLRDNKNGFDIVISDVYMPDIDGFKLLEEVGLDLDLPVIMMSADDSKDVVMKGVTHGACDYLIKPVRMEALKNIWQHVVRKRKHDGKDKDLEQSASVDDGEKKQKALENVDISSSATDGNGRRKRNDEEDDDDKDDSSTLKKPRVVWSVELHQQFVAAVNQLGIDKAVPKKILELMNVPGLTRENVASHLQKYRLYLRRLSGVSQHQNGLGSSFLGSDGSFGTMPSLHGFDFQALRSPGQVPAPGLVPFQSGALVRPSSRPPMSVSVVDQRNLFGFDSPKLRYGEAQQQMGSNADQMNLLHGIPTNMEPKQLASLNQSAQPLGRMNLQVNSQGGQNNPLVTQMTQPISRAQALNKSNASPVSTLSASVGQPIVLNGISSGGLAQGGSTNGVRGTIYNPASQASSMVDFSLNGGSQLTGNGFPPRNTGMNSSLTPQGLLQGEVNINAKGPQGFVPSYEYLNELQQYKPLDWGLQNVGSTFDASQNPDARGSMEVPPSTFVQPGFSSVQKSGHDRVGVPIFSSGEAGQNSNSNFGRPAIPFVVDGSPRVKVESLQDPNCAPNLFLQHYGQDDMLSAILKQQDGVGSVGTEFGYDGYRLDNLPA